MQTDPVTVLGLRSAIEGRDARKLTEFYNADAVLQIIDADNPPSRPRELRGREAIAAYFDDVCGRAMSHRVEIGIREGDRIAFTETCTYPGGERVACQAMLDLNHDLIARQVMLVVWDA